MNPKETVNASIIEKIKKLFAIGQRRHNNDGSSNEAEAAAAMAKAQDMLTKYNLDLRTVQDATAEKKGAVEGGKRDQVQIKRSAMYYWQQKFWKAIAEANYCFHWVVDTQEPRGDRWRRVKRHVILGSEVNVTVVQMMGEYLTQTMEDILPYPNNERLSRSAMSWREGCAERLIQRVKRKGGQGRIRRHHGRRFQLHGAGGSGFA